MGNPMQDSLLETVRQIRDEKRPRMEDVVSVIDELMERFTSAGFSDYRKSARGPETWSWVDMTNSGLGYEKWYVLSHSTMEGTEGYPLLTIRSSVAPRLDSHLSVSGLIVGPDRRDIETAIAMAITNQRGAFEGLKESISNLVELMTKGQSFPVSDDFVAVIDDDDKKKREVN